MADAMTRLPEAHWSLNYGVFPGAINFTSLSSTRLRPCSKCGPSSLCPSITLPSDYRFSCRDAAGAISPARWPTSPRQSITLSTLPSYVSSPNEQYLQSLHLSLRSAKESYFLPRSNAVIAWSIFNLGESTCGEFA